MRELLQSTLRSQGYCLTQLALPISIGAHVETRNWKALDDEMGQLTSSGGAIFEALKAYAHFKEIEFIISIRSSEEYPDEDGIWHDDGSRLLAFSLSLTLHPERLEGGKLEIRRREAPGALSTIPTPPFGSMIVFATGQWGFEHRICRVASGERVIIAGWAS